MFLLKSEFDDEADEYQSYYAVFLLTDPPGEDWMQGSWAFLETAKPRFLATIPVDSVKFDPTLRKSLDASVLDPILPGV
jgi:hypothetical protein